MVFQIILYGLGIPILVFAVYMGISSRSKKDE